MQGSGISSESIWTAFDSHCTAPFRRPKHIVKVAWLRNYDNSLNFATVGTSLVEGTDIIQGNASFLTEADFFQYYDETDRVLRIEYDRQVEEPLGGLAMTQANILLDNTDLRFTPNINGTIGTAITSNRPVKAFLGFRVSSQDKTLPVFYGLSEIPVENKANRTLELLVYDYIKYIEDYPLDSAIYEDQRSDQIINDILVNGIGFTASQISLDTGLNTIAFGWIKKGSKAGQIIRRLCEAEGGHFYQDETGLLRFENRRHYNQSPHQTVQWTINSEDIYQWEEDTKSDVFNRIIVKASPRSSQVSQEVWKNGTTIELQHNEIKVIWITAENPMTNVITPVATTDYTANTASDGSGTDKTSGVTITKSAFVDSVKLTITNNGVGLVYLTFLRVRATPATIVQQIEVVKEDTASIDKYERHELTIENDFIDESSFADYLAKVTLLKYKDPKKRVIVTIPGIPQLQLKDLVRVKDMDQGTYKNYRIMRILGSITNSLTQTLYLREVNASETETEATVGSSLVEGTDIVGI